MTKAMKFDDGKPPIDLVDKELIIEVAKILGYGAEKYEAHNWRTGLPLTRYYSAAMRHLMAWNDGEDVDPESGLSHISHAACNMMFILRLMKDKPELDNRPKIYMNPSLPDSGLSETEVANLIIQHPEESITDIKTGAGAPVIPPRRWYEK